MPSSTAAPAPPARPAKIEDSWVFVSRLRDMGLIIIRLSPIGIKWETQMADAVGDLKTHELTVYNDQTRKYCVQSATDLAAQVQRTAELERHASERRGWKFSEWKKVGTDTILGFKTNVYARTRTRGGFYRLDDKIWILADPRLEQYKGLAGDILALASRTRLPEPGLPCKRTCVTTDLRPHAAHFEPTKLKFEPGEDPLALLGPPPGEADRSNASKITKPSKPVKADKSSSKSAAKHPDETDPTVEFSVVSFTREKADPSRFKLPKGYTRVKNVSDVLELGGLDGTLSY